MRSKTLISLVMVILIGFSALATFAETKEQKSQLYIVWDILVKPSMVGEYEAASKEEISLYAKYEFPHPWVAYSTNDFHYYFIMKAENYSTIDKLYKAFGETKEKMGEEEYQALMKRFAGTYEYIHTSIYKHNPELSYTPEKPRLKSEERNFFRLSFFYIQGGMQKEAEEISKEWVALYKSKNILDEYDILVGDIGTDMPVYIAAGGGKSAADFFSQWEKISELLGKEGKALWKKTFAATRKFEQKSGNIRPDLSYTPKEK